MPRENSTNLYRALATIDRDFRADFDNSSVSCFDNTNGLLRSCALMLQTAILSKGVRVQQNTNVSGLLSILFNINLAQILSNGGSNLNQGLKLENWVKMMPVETKLIKLFLFSCKNDYMNQSVCMYVVHSCWHQLATRLHTALVLLSACAFRI